MLKRASGQRSRDLNPNGDLGWHQYIDDHFIGPQCSYCENRAYERAVVLLHFKERSIRFLLKTKWAD